MTVAVVSLPLEVDVDGRRVLVPARTHTVDCVELRNRDFTVEFSSLSSAEDWLAGVFRSLGVPCEACPVCIPAAEFTIGRSLRDVLESAKAADPGVRIQYRDRIAAYGREAVERVTPWLRDAGLASFAVRVLMAVNSIDPDASVRGLLLASRNAVEPARTDAARFLDELRAVAGWPRIDSRNRSVAFVGNFPYLATVLSSAHEEHGRAVRLDSSTFIDTVVVGWDVDDLSAATALVHQLPRPARFLPQEGWAHLVMFGIDWWFDDPATLNRFADEGHPIGDIRSVWPSGPAWPGTNVVLNAVDLEGNTPLLQEEHWLRRMGYQITRMDRDERWAVLKQAVAARGVHDVAFHIAGLVKLRRLQADGERLFRHAIAEWEHDLGRLKRSFYRPSDGFPWPGDVD